MLKFLKICAEKGVHQSGLSRPVVCLLPGAVGSADEEEEALDVDDKDQCRDKGHKSIIVISSGAASDSAATTPIAIQ